MKECSTCGACLDDVEERCLGDGSLLQPSLAGPPLIDGRLRLERRIGRGGMGTVYRAHHLGLERTVAVKLILPGHANDPELIGRFEIEAKALGRLDHPNIVRVTDYGIDPRQGGIPYLVMEHLDGARLSTLLRDSPIAIDDALTILDGIARSIDFAHEHGVLHRDLKPDNVIVRNRAGEPPDAWVLDFGLARLVERSVASAEGGHENRAPAGEDGQPAHDALSKVGILVGTPGYMAPDVVRGNVGPASDIYSFGLIAYELLAGRPPFRGSPEELIEQHIHATPPSPSRTNPGLPSVMDGPVMRALEKDPARRPRTAGELAENLRHARRSALLAAWKQRELPRRIVISACLTAVLLFISHGAVDWSVFRSLDKKLMDAWFSVARPRPMSPRVLMIRLPDDFWDQTTDASRLANAIDQLYRGGARGVAIDLILPERFGKDAELARLVLLHQETLVLSAAPIDDRTVMGTEAVGGFVTGAIGAERAGRLFGIVSIEEDADGIVRRYPLCAKDTRGILRPSLASRALSILSIRSGPPDCSDLGIDFSIDWRQNAMDWGDAMKLAERDGALFRDRMILLSGTSVLGEDVHRVPHPRSLEGWVSGVVIHGLAIETVLQNRAVTTPPRVLILSVLGVAMTAFAFVLLWSRRWIAPLAILSAAVAACAALFLKWRILIPAAHPLACVIAVAICALIIRQWLSGRPAREA